MCFFKDFMFNFFLCVKFGGQVHTELCSGLERDLANGQWDEATLISRS